MAKQIWCIVEPAIQGLVQELLMQWGVQAHMISPDGEIAGVNQLLPPQEQSIERWAYAALREIGETSVLLVQAELIPAQRAKGYGLLLAERIRAERIVPTIIMTLDPDIAQRASTRRGRLADGHARRPVVPMITANDELKKFTTPPFVLWDPLTGKSGFDKAYAVALKTTVGLSPQRKDALQHELREALQDEEAAAVRHRLKNMLASLRIMDGAYRNGWLSHDEINQALATLRERAVDPNQQSALHELADTLATMPQDPLTPVVAPRDMTIAVCDDLWETAGWDQVIPPLVRHLFGMETHGVTSLDALEHYLKEAREEIVPPRTLLLDVHVGEQHVNAGYLESLHERFPNIDVILFTTDLNDGVLVRKAYELGYRTFFKELDETARNTRRYAMHLRRVLEQSIQSYPVMHLVQLCDELDVAGMDMEPGTVVTTMQSVMRLWKDTGERSSVFGLTALHERLTKCVYSMMTKRKNWYPFTPKGQVDWEAILLQMKGVFSAEGSLSWQLFDRSFFLARYARNQMAHNADAILDADSNLPALGVALTQLVGCIVLARFTYPDAMGDLDDAAYDEHLKLCLLEYAKAVLYSTEPMKTRTRSRLKLLLEDGAFCEPMKLCKLIEDLARQSDPIFLGHITTRDGAATRMPAKYLQDVLGALNDIDLDTMQEMTAYQWVLVLYCIFVQDR